MATSSNDLVEWIATHALPIWAALLVAALLVGDAAWQWNRQHGLKTLAAGREPVAIRGVTALLLLVCLCLLFAAIALALKEEAMRWLPSFDEALAEDLRASMQPGTLRLVAAVSRLGDMGSVAAITVVVLAVLFLPTEGLYAEVIRRPGLFESLQRDHHVTVAGPTTRTRWPLITAVSPTPTPRPSRSALSTKE